MPINQNLLKVIFTAFFTLCAFTFISISLTALFHILIFVPGLYLTYIRFKNNDLKLSLSEISLLLLILWSILSVIFNLDIIPKPHRNIIKLKYQLIGLLSVPCFYYFIKTDQDLKKSKLLFKVFIWATSIASLSGLIAYFSGYNILKMKPACHPTRTCGMYGMYMTYGYGIGLYLTILTGTMIYFLKNNRGKNLKSYIPLFVLNTVSFILSFPRGAYVGYFGSLPFFFYKKNKKLFLSIISILFITSILTVAIVPKVRELVFDVSRVRSIETRVSNYKAAFYAAKEKPLFGYGYKNFEPNSKTIKKKYNIEFPNFQGHGHSNFFEHLGSTGFVGLFLLILFHVFWLKETYLRDDIVGFVTFPFVVHFTLSGQFQYTFGDGENLFLIMAVYAISQVKLPTLNGSQRSQESAA